MLDWNNIINNTITCIRWSDYCLSVLLLVCCCQVNTWVQMQKYINIFCIKCKYSSCFTELQHSGCLWAGTVQYNQPVFFQIGLIICHYIFLWNAPKTFKLWTCFWIQQFPEMIACLFVVVVCVCSGNQPEVRKSRKTPESYRHRGSAHVAGSQCSSVRCTGAWDELQLPVNSCC